GARWVPGPSPRVALRLPLDPRGLPLPGSSGRGGSVRRGLPRCPGGRRRPGHDPRRAGAGSGLRDVHPTRQGRRPPDSRRPALLLQRRVRRPLPGPSRGRPGLTRSAFRRLRPLAVLLVALPATGAAAPPAFDGRRALRDIERLVAIGPRPPGSAALARARAYLESELRGAGWRVREQPFTAQTPNGPIPLGDVGAGWPGPRAGGVAGCGDHRSQTVPAL